MVARSCSLLVALSWAATGSALAGVPDPENCTTPDCIVLSPSGELPVEVVVRDVDGEACEGVLVTIAFDALCTDLIDGVICAPATSYSGTTDADGAVTINAPVGGVCEGADAVTIVSDGVEIASYDVLASPDVNGDGIVNVPDLIEFSIALDTVAPTLDLCNCDGLVDDADYVVHQNQFLSSGCFLGGGEGEEVAR